MNVDRVVARHAEDTVEGVQVLVQSDLEDGRSALAVGGRRSQVTFYEIRGARYIPRGDGRVGKEEYPDAVPALAIYLNNLLLVADPVLVPAPDSR